MRTGFTGVKVVTAVAIFLSGSLLLYHMQEGALGGAVLVPGSWYAVASLVLVVAVAAAWTRPAGSQSPLVVGVAILGTQFLLLIATGIALEATRPKVPGAQLTAPLTDGIACLLAAVLAVGTWMPLRSAVTSHRGHRRARAMRARGTALAQRRGQAQARSDEADRGFVLGVPNAESQTGADASEPSESQAQDGTKVAGAAATVPLAVDCEIEIPVPLVFSQLHEVGAVDQAVLAAVRPGLTMNIPVSLLTRGLREGEVALPISALASYLPKGVPYDAASADSGEMIAEPMILLPLEMIIPQIPVEAFALPERATPAWLSLEWEESDSAIVLSMLSGSQESDSDGVG